MQELVVESLMVSLAMVMLDVLVDCSGMITVSATDEGLPRITAPVSGIDYDGSHTLPGFLLSSQ